MISPKSLLLVLLFTPFLVAAGKRETAFKPDQLVTYKTVGDTVLKLHVFYPEGHKATDRTPVIVLFFGGGWLSGQPAKLYPQCARFASRGMVAISAEYRVKSRNNTTPVECVQDGKSAIRWIREHAGELGIDPDKLVAGGGSAGGQVAAAAGTGTTIEEPGESATSCRPNALVLFNPVFDNGPGGYGYDRVKEYWQQFSPMNNIDSKTPPTILFFGDHDQHVPVATIKEYQKRMETKGRRCDMFIYEGQKHGFFNYNSLGGDKNKYFNETMRQAEIFLTSLGYLKPAHH